MPDYLTLAGYLRSNGVTSPAQCELLVTVLLIERPTGTNPPPLTPPLTAADYFDLAGYIRDNGVTSPAQCEQLITTLLLQRPTGGVAPPPFPTGATHYWALNEASGSRVDSIAGLDLDPTGSPAQVSGPLDFAVSINGSLSPRFLKSAAAPSLRGAGAWTLNFWTKSIGTLDSYNAITQLSSGSAANTDFAYYMAQGTGGSTALRTSAGVSLTTTNTDLPNGVFDGQWHMVTLIFGNSPNSVDYYADGILAGNGTNATGPNAVSQPFNVGDLTITGLATEQGISDVGFWPRALTNQEITDLYNGGTPLRP